MVNRPVDYYWDEDDLIPVTAEEQRRSLAAAIAKYRAEGLIPQEDPGCQCLTCRLFRADMERGGHEQQG